MRKRANGRYHCFSGRRGSRSYVSGAAQQPAQRDRANFVRMSVIRDLCAAVKRPERTATNRKCRWGGVGGLGGLPPPDYRSPIKSSQNIDILRHRDPTGRPCLTVAGFLRRHSINKDFNEHVISASNSCGTPIKIRVCYYKSVECISMYVPGRGRKEAILGTPSSTYQFQYEFREIF